MPAGAAEVYRYLPATNAPAQTAHHRIVVVGAGPVGLTAALDLGQRGHEVIVLSRNAFIAGGSRAICFSKRSLDIWNQLGVAGPMVAEGVSWKIGKVFRGDSPDPLYQFDLEAGSQQEMPPFINLPQFRAEEILLDALQRLPNVTLRWGHEVIGVRKDKQELCVRVGGATYRLTADWILACDGSRSPIRTMLGLEFEGETFDDSFLIADVRFEHKRDIERRFWFDPPWKSASALMHQQPDNVWRLDFQLGVGVDHEAAAHPANVERLVKGMVGEDTPFEPVWYSVYRFQCRRLGRLVHGRIVFLGDSACVVSPFGARGANGGIANAANLCWKVDAIIRGKANDQLLETFDLEAGETARVNILNSTRSTNFIAPRSDSARLFRDAVLDLAERHAFARPFVNSGRLSAPAAYPASFLSQEDQDDWGSGIPTGSPAVDAPLSKGWLIKTLRGRWTLLADRHYPECPVPTVVADTEAARSRYDLTPGAAYLIRPDHYVAARWKNFDCSSFGNAEWPI